MTLVNIVLFASLLIGQSIHAQERNNISFRDFIGLLKKQRAADDMCNKFLHTVPNREGESSVSISILFERPRYAAVLIRNAYSFSEESSTLETYDWNGNKLDVFEYGYELGGDYQQKTIRCEINNFDEVTRTTHITEGRLVPVFDAAGNQIGMPYTTVLDSSSVERFRISEKGFFEREQ